MATYAEQLRDPRWQRRRAERLAACDYTCKKCGDTKTELNVHHRKYVRGRKPWEYDDHELDVLCRPCHEAEHNQKNQHHDSELELRIERAYKRVLEATNKDDQRTALAAMSSLLRERSPQKIKELEHSRGLR